MRKRLIYILIFLSFIFKCWAQHNYIKEDLKKYIYYIHKETFTNGYINGKLVAVFEDTSQAACFFIKRKGKLYLLSASHVLSGIDFKTKTIPPSFPDSFNIKVFNKENNSYEDFSVSLRSAKTNVNSNYINS